MQSWASTKCTARQVRGQTGTRGAAPKRRPCRGHGFSCSADAAGSTCSRWRKSNLPAILLSVLPEQNAPHGIHRVARPRPAQTISMRDIGAIAAASSCSSSAPSRPMYSAIWTCLWQWTTMGRTRPRTSARLARSQGRQALPRYLRHVFEPGLCRPVPGGKSIDLLGIRQRRSNDVQSLQEHALMPI